MRIEPAELAFDERGTPFSRAYGDVYHSAESGPGQAEHVFLQGNGLPARWAGARVFTIVECGFGLGLNFLATWARWKTDASRCERLHFVAIEKHPFDRKALATLHARLEPFAGLSHELRQAWPVLVGGLHRLAFDDGRVTLTLGFGDVATLLPKLRLQADALYLDGFAPRCNAGMWSERVMKDLARLSRPGTTYATYSAAAAVRDALSAAGFTVEKVPGFGAKRDMLRGRYAPRWPVRRADAPPVSRRHAIVVGAGVAGAAVCQRLAARGWQVDLIDARSETSVASVPGFPGAFHPHLSPDDAIRSRALRNGYLYALRHWSALADAGSTVDAARCGALQLADWKADQVARLGSPPDFAEYVERDDARDRSGSAVASGGWWFPQGGWARLSSVAAMNITAAASGGRLDRHFGRAVASIARNDNGDWHAHASDGRLIASAPVCILANAHGATRLANFGRALNRIRGQVTRIEIAPGAGPRSVVLGSGFVVPAIGGVLTVGSTYDVDDDDEAIRPDSHQANLERLARLAPDVHSTLDPSKLARLSGEVAFRCVVPDRMPLVGEVPDVSEAGRIREDLRGAHLPAVPRCRGLHAITGLGSRGLVWSALAAELVASRLEGEPLAVEGDIADAIDPARFVLRQLRHGTL